MVKNLMWKLTVNDVRQNKLLSGATFFCMALSAMLTALTVLLLISLTGAVDSLMEQAQVPDYLQMHAEDTAFWENGTALGERDAVWEAEEAQIARFAKSREEVSEWQVCRFLNLDNSRVVLGGRSLADSTQDNGLAVQGEQFDYLLDMENRQPQVMPGEVYVPVCYRARYHLSPGDIMEIGSCRLEIAGFLRDAQMNSMMASSKRFLVNESDYEKVKADSDAASGRQEDQVLCTEEYLIEFLLKQGADANVFGTAYAAAGLPANGPAITKPLMRMMNALSDGTMIFLIFLVSIAVLLISILCIHFMFSLQMERDRREVGMLKALGIGKKEIRHLYFAKYILFSAGGALTGLLAALALKVPLEGQIRELYGVPAGGFTSIVLPLSAVCFAEAVILFFIVRSFKKTEKLSALEALFPVQNRRTGKDRNLIIGLVAAACAFLALVPRNLYHTMSAPDFVTYMGIGAAQIRMDVRHTPDLDGTVKRLAASLEQDTRVEKYAALRTVSCTAVTSEGKQIGLMVETGAHSVFPVSVREGRLPYQERELALSSMNAEELGLSVGDRLHLISGKNGADYTICGIYSDITNGGKTAKAYAVGADAPAVWSVLYVSLKESAVKEEWMEQYRKSGADVTDIASYVQETYGQTLTQLHLASGVALGAALSVTGVVIMLFVRLAVERKRYQISLHKALGFTNGSLKCAYFKEGMLPAVFGTGAGLFSGVLFGERFCGVILRFFGADSFRFVLNPAELFFLLPALLLSASAAAVWIGEAEIRNVSACECCFGKE